MHLNDFREDIQPTRGQWAEIARLGLELLGIDQPATRGGATEAILRLRRTRDQRDDTPATTAPGGVQ